MGTEGVELASADGVCFVCGRWLPCGDVGYVRVYGGNGAVSGAHRACRECRRAVELRGVQLYELDGLMVQIGPWRANVFGI